MLIILTFIKKDKFYFIKLNFGFSDSKIRRKIIMFIRFVKSVTNKIHIVSKKILILKSLKSKL